MDDNASSATALIEQKQADFGKRAAKIPIFAIPIRPDTLADLAAFKSAGRPAGGTGLAGDLSPLQPYLDPGAKYLSALYRGKLDEKINVRGVSNKVEHFHVLVARDGRVFLSNGVMVIPAAGKALDSALASGTLGVSSYAELAELFIRGPGYLQRETQTALGQFVLKGVRAAWIVGPDAVERGVGSLDVAARPDLLHLTEYTLTDDPNAIRISSPLAATDQDGLFVPGVQLAAALLALGAIDKHGAPLAPFQMYVRTLPAKRGKPRVIATRQSSPVGQVFLTVGDKLALINSMGR